MHVTSRRIVETYKKKFICAKKEDMWVNGDFNSIKARLINVVLSRCTGHDYCAKDEEIN